MSFPSLGFGLGLRAPHLKDILEGRSRAQWFEALTENYLGLPGLGAGQARRNLHRVREIAPVTLHGVSLSIGSTAPLNEDYLRRVDELIREIQPAWVSDHLCWTGVHGLNSHDLLPLPLNETTLAHVASRISRVQDTWKRPLVVENVSSYVRFDEETRSEAEFLSELCRRTGCHLLLDVNNVYVSARNRGFDAADELDKMPLDRVVQIHLAGHSDRGDIVIDTHDAPVRPEVWDLYRAVIHRVPSASTMIEWDADIPPLETVENELMKAKALHDANT